MAVRAGNAFRQAEVPCAGLQCANPQSVHGCVERFDVAQCADAAPKRAVHHAHAPVAIAIGPGELGTKAVSKGAPAPPQRMANVGNAAKLPCRS